MHARTRGAFIKYHQLLALFKTPQRRGERADVHRLRGDVEKMRQDTADLAIQNPDQLAAARHFNTEQLFRGETERVLLIHRRDIVEPVEIGDRLQVGLMLDQLFGAAVQEADVGIDAGDDLAVELQHEAQHAVRRRVLRSKIDGEVAECGCFGHDMASACKRMANSEWRMAPTRGFLMVRSAAKPRVSNHPAQRPLPSFETPRCARLLRMRVELKSQPMSLSTYLRPGLLIPGKHRIIRAFPWREEIEISEFLVEADRLVKHPLLLVVVPDLDKSGKWEVLAQRVAVEAVIGQQTPHIRVAGEDHAVEVVGFALEPVGAGKHLDDRGHLRSLIGFGAQTDARIQS